MLRRLLLPAALLLAVILVVILGIQLRDVRRQYGDFIQRATTPHAGVYVPAARLVSLTGDTVVVGDAPTGRRQVLLVFTTTCPYCRASLPAWKQLAAAATGAPGAPEVIGVSLDSAAATERYVGEHHLPMPVVRFEPGRLQSLFRARRVPLIIVIDGRGRVLYGRTGVLSDPAAVDSVLRAARISTPQSTASR